MSKQTGIRKGERHEAGKSTRQCHALDGRVIHVGIYLGAQSSTGVAMADMNAGYWAERFHGVVVRVM